MFISNWETYSFTRSLHTSTDPYRFPRSSQQTPWPPSSSLIDRENEHHDWVDANLRLLLSITVLFLPKWKVSKLQGSCGAFKQGWNSYCYAKHLAKTSKHFRQIFKIVHTRRVFLITLTEIISLPPPSPSLHLHTLPLTIIISSLSQIRKLKYLPSTSYLVKQLFNFDLNYALWWNVYKSKCLLGRE